MKSPRLLVVAAAAALALLAPGAPASAVTDPPASGAFVRAGHFVPGIGSTRIDLVPTSGEASTSVEMTSGAGYGEVTDYQQLDPGTYTATVRDSGAKATSSPMLARSFVVEEGEARTIAVLGSAEQPRLAFLSDDLTPPKTGSSRVRVLAASSQAGDVSVQAVDGPTVATDAVLGQATAYSSVPSGAWALEVTGAGTATEKDVSLAAGSVYTVVVLDANDQGVRLRVITDAAGASTTPQGGADTGAGSTAEPSFVLRALLAAWST